jgi:rhodanese-related sulfurtransferase
MKKILFLLTSLLGSSIAMAENIPAVSPHEALQMQTQKQAVIVDVRENDEWNSGHIAGAIHVPLSDLQNHLAELSKYQNSQLIVQCRSGARSAKAADILAKAGFTNVHNLAGGLNAWQKENLTIQQN